MNTKTMNTKTASGNGFNVAVVLRWRGIAHRVPTCTWVGDSKHLIRVRTDEIKVERYNTERQSLSDVVPKGTIEVDWRQFCRFLRDAGLKVRRMRTSFRRESAVYSTVIK